MVKETLRFTSTAFVLMALLWGCTGAAGSEKDASAETKGTVKPTAVANEPKIAMHGTNVVALWPSDWPVDRASNGSLLISMRGSEDNSQVIQFSLDDVSDSSERYRRRLILPIRVNSFAFSPDRNWVAMDEIGESGPSRVFVMDRSKIGPMAIFHGPMDYASLKFMPDNKRLAMASGANVWIADLEMRRITSEWSIKDEEVDYLSWIVGDSSESFFMAPKSDTQVILAYELESRRPVSIPNLDQMPGAEYCFRLRGKWYAYIGGVVTDLETQTSVVKEREGARGMELAPDGNSLAFRHPSGAVSNVQKVIVVDTQTWKVRHRLQPSGRSVGPGIKFLTPDVLVEPGKITYFWNIQTGKIIARLVPWAVTEYTMENGVKANRSDWVLALPDGRYFGSEQAHTLLDDLKTRDPKVMADFRIALGLLPETEE